MSRPESFTHLTDLEFLRNFEINPSALPAQEALVRLRSLIERNAALKDKMVALQDWMEAQPDVSNA